jgi:hypothetical protein
VKYDAMIGAAHTSPSSTSIQRPRLRAAGEAGVAAGP